VSRVVTRSKVTTRYEYAIPTPAMWADVKEAMSWAERDRVAKGLEIRWDDVIKVIGDEEEIVVYWEESS
jgi:hypothetical protein